MYSSDTSAKAGRQAEYAEEVKKEETSASTFYEACSSFLIILT